nr:zinc finger BED domain-containing protein RICESLEEPER 2-like [Ipomoea batatas]
MARGTLVVPISTVASESTFRTSGRVLDAFRSSLTPKIVEALVYAQDWLRLPNQPLFVEENIDEVEKFEKVANNCPRFEESHYPLTTGILDWISRVCNGDASTILFNLGFVGLGLGTIGDLGNGGLEVGAVV